jgi:hypothetical protein
MISHGIIDEGRLIRALADRVSKIDAEYAIKNCDFAYWVGPAKDFILE